MGLNRVVRFSFFQIFKVVLCCQKQRQGTNREESENQRLKLNMGKAPTINPQKFANRRPLTVLVVGGSFAAGTVRGQVTFARNTV